MAHRDLRRRKLSPFGKKWLTGWHKPQARVPEPTITAVVYFEELPVFEQIISHVEEHLWPITRFNSVATPAGWQTPEGPMDKAYHFTRLEASSETDIDAHVNAVMTFPLDHSRPLWTLTCIYCSHGRSALIIRLHHSIGDGLGMIIATLPLFEIEGGGDILDKLPLPAILKGRKPAVTPTATGEGFLRRICCGFGRSVTAFVRGCLMLVVVTPDTELKINTPLVERTPFLQCSGSSVYTRLKTASLAEINTVRHRHHCTVNDVIMAAFAGALRRYCVEDLLDPAFQGSQTRKVIECKTFLMMALPRPIDEKDKNVSLRNSFITPLYKLPVNEATPGGRLARCISLIKDLKCRAYMAGLKFGTDMGSCAPSFVTQKIASELISKATSCFTNLPMATVPLRLLGKEVKEFQVVFVNPIPQFSMVTYNGAVFWNVVADPAVIPDPRALGEYFCSEIAELQVTEHIS